MQFKVKTIFMQQSHKIKQWLSKPENLQLAEQVIKIIQLAEKVIRLIYLFEKVIKIVMKIIHLLLK